MPDAYRPLRPAHSRFVDVRGLRYHLWQWGDPGLASAQRPLLVLLHGWMDVGASYQFVVDAFSEPRWVVAPDWRGFGHTTVHGADCYWFADYFGDLDALLDALAPDAAVDLAGHSMGGNVAMTYAGVRPARVRRLINLEGFGLPRAEPSQAPLRLARWLDELKAPARLHAYASADAVAQRLIKNNPRLAAERAAWLATQWATAASDGSWHVRADPAHKRVHPMLYRVDETLETWKRITAPMMWVEGDLTDADKWWGHRYPRAEFHERLAVVPARVEKHVLSPSGHMLHHEQPQRLAALIEAFLAGTPH
jgi:pimeloyl-ACP methyl ester carboxylesterase